MPTPSQPPRHASQPATLNGPELYISINLCKVQIGTDVTHTHEVVTTLVRQIAEHEYPQILFSILQSD